ncbi:hypothetical protein CsSME_00001090 [Camellia sinensis var. sinensis]
MCLCVIMCHHQLNSVLSSQLMCLSLWFLLRQASRLHGWFRPFYCITVKQIFSNLGSLIGHFSNPLGQGLGRDRVISEHEPMERTRNTDETKSSDVRIDWLEKMSQQLPPPHPSLVQNEPNNNDDIITLTQKFNKMK